jgi:hypothetical protein
LPRDICYLDEAQRAQSDDAAVVTAAIIISRNLFDAINPDISISGGAIAEIHSGESFWLAWDTLTERFPTSKTPLDVLERLREIRKPEEARRFINSVHQAVLALGG